MSGSVMTDQLRSDEARRRREAAAVMAEPAGPTTVMPDDERASGQDDTLTLLFLCCHPELTPASQLALTLRAVGGLTTGEIARAFLVPEWTMAQRISRAKQRIAAAGARFTTPPAGEWAGRLRVVLPEELPALLGPSFPALGQSIFLLVGDRATLRELCRECIGCMISRRSRRGLALVVT